MAAPPHRIRLRGPWQCIPQVRLLPDACGRWVPAAVSLPGPTTLVMPGDWSAVLGADFAGVVAFERRFAAPRGLEEGQHVWIVFDEVLDWGEVALNGRPLGRMASRATGLPEGEWRLCPARFDITAALRPRNRLVVHVHCPALGPDGFPLAGPNDKPRAGGLTGLVWLEITGG